MVNVRFTFGAEFAALLATAVVASENDRPYLAPMLFCGIDGEGLMGARDEMPDLRGYA